jgi:hypothetical protein
MDRATDCSGALHFGLQGFDLSSIRQTSRALPSSESRLGPKTKAPLPRGGLMCVKRLGPPGDAAKGRGLSPVPLYRVEQVTH